MTPRAPRARRESIPARWLYHRPLLARLCQAAYQTAPGIIRAAPPDDEGLTPGRIAVVQTFGDDLGWHPHVHALVTRGGWDRAGTWVPVPFVDGEAAALVFRHKVFSCLQAEGLLSEERTRLLLLWRHSGFSVHTSVTVPPDDRDGLERLARYLLRPPVSLDRLRVDDHAQAIAYAARSKLGLQARTAATPVGPTEFLARVVMHIPEPRRHVIRYYGAYSSVVRARRRREATVTAGAPRGEASAAPVPDPPTDRKLRVSRRRRAALIRRIYEVDPLVCPRCAGPMRIISFITEPEVIHRILTHLATKAAAERSPPSLPQRHPTAA